MTRRSPSSPLSLPGLMATVTTTARATVTVMMAAVTAATVAGLDRLAAAVSGRSSAPRGLPSPSPPGPSFQTTWPRRAPLSRRPSRVMQMTECAAARWRRG